DGNFEVEMRSGSDTRLADESDDLSAMHLRSGMQPGSEPRQMGIGGLQMSGVTDAQVLPVVAVPTDLLDDAVGSGAHGSAGRCPEIDSLVEAAIAEYRMDAPAVRRGHGRLRHRVPQIEPSDSSAIAVDQGDLAVSGLVTVELMDFPSIVD